MIDIEKYYAQLAEIKLSREDLATTQQVYNDLINMRSLIIRPYAHAYENHKIKYLTIYDSYNKPDEKGKMPTNASLDMKASIESVEEKTYLKKLEILLEAIDKNLGYIQSIFSLYQTESKLVSQRDQI